MDRFRSAPWWFARPSSSRRYMVYCRAFALGSAIHLTLPDALQSSWIAADVVCWLGALLLAITGCFAGWALCAVGLAVPLLWLGDQLTQSAYMLASSLAALACFAVHARRRLRHYERDLLATVRVLTVGTYALAAFHKLNGDFLNPDVSCASGGVRILAENWSLSALATPELAGVWPPLFLGAEVAIASTLVARPGTGLLLALVVHIPLTIVFAPAFAFTMLPGWIACLTEQDIAHLEDTIRRRSGIVLATGIGLGGASIALYFRDHWIAYPFWFLKELALWIALSWVATALLRSRAGALAWWSAWRQRPTRRGRAVVVAAGLLWLVNGITPYLGLQYHHTGAMLSNLRIDRGCWNHLFVPESWRVGSPYVRIESADIGGAVRGRAVLESSITGRLWSVRALYRARERWCDAGAAPVHIGGEHDGEPFTVPDLCRQWPFERPALPGMRAFQTNIVPECPQSCIH